jgi:membrane protease YdiL (CAAX protease family)
MDFGMGAGRPRLQIAGDHHDTGTSRLLGTKTSHIDWGSRSLRERLVSCYSNIATFVLINLCLIWFVDRMPVLRAELMSGITMYASLPKWLDWPGLVANGIAEEVGFRGYAIERIEEMTGSTLLGASVPFVVNVLVHAPVWGFHGMLAKAPVLMLFVVLYLWRRNLPACALAHVLMDIRAFEL